MNEDVFVLTKNPFNNHDEKSKLINVFYGKLYHLALREIDSSEHTTDLIGLLDRLRDIDKMKGVLGNE